MNNETLEKNLKEYRENIASIKLKNLKINDCKKIIDKINEEYAIKITPTYSEGGKGNGTNSNIETMLIKKEKDIEIQEEQIKKLQEEIDILQRKVDDIDARMLALTDYQRELIRLRYINAISIDEMANLKRRTSVTISRQIKGALKKMRLL